MSGTTPKATSCSYRFLKVMAIWCTRDGKAMVKVDDDNNLTM